MSAHRNGPAKVYLSMFLETIDQIRLVTMVVFARYMPIERPGAESTGAQYQHSREVLVTDACSSNQLLCGCDAVRDKHIGPSASEPFTIHFNKFSSQALCVDSSHVCYRGTGLFHQLQQWLSDPADAHVELS
jgi:hypothetical protein